MSPPAVVSGYPSHLTPTNLLDRLCVSDLDPESHAMNAALSHSCPCNKTPEPRNLLTSYHPSSWEVQCPRTFSEGYFVFQGNALPTSSCDTGKESTHCLKPLSKGTSYAHEDGTLRLNHPSEAPF